MEHLRNIVDQVLVPHTAFEAAVKRVRQCLASVKGAAEPICLPLLGESRTGKSRVQNTVMQDFPAQRTSEGLIVPILRARTPSKPTVKGLAQVLLRALGDPLWEKGTENTLTARLMTLLVKAQTLMIILDEFQHFYDKTSHRVIHHTADWLKILVDESQVALVVSGLPSCMAVIRQNEQLAGRFMAPVTMPRFNWVNDKDREEFCAILSTFHEELSKHFEIPDLGTDEMAFRVYCATGGLVGYVAKFMRHMVWNAIDTKNPTVGLKELQQAFNDSILTEQPNAINPFVHGFCVGGATALDLERASKIGLPAPEPVMPRATKRKSDPVAKAA